MALYFQIRLLTGEIARRSLYQPADAIKRAPGIYQEFIEKNYALRVTLLLRLARIAQRKFLPQGLGRVQPPPSDLAARFLTTEDAFFLQSPLQNNQFWIIDKQHSNRNADNGGRPCELRSIPHKVIRPTISPWMEEANHLATVGISSCNVGSLEPIAVDASKPQILWFDEPTMLSAGHVINLEWSEVECRGHVAVFAAGIGSLPDLANQSSIHYACLLS